MAETFDVVEVTFGGKVINVVAVEKTARSAEAIVDMAVLRRGVDRSFFASVPASTHAVGDTYTVEEV